MPLLLQRIIAGAAAFQHNLRRLQLKRLARLGRLHQRSSAGNRGAHANFADFFKILDSAIFKYNLQVLKKRTVVQLDKAQGLAVPYGAHPSAHLKFLAQKFFRASE